MANHQSQCDQKNQDGIHASNCSTFGEPSQFWKPTKIGDAGGVHFAKDIF
jgi:hypothetical protein